MIKLIRSDDFSKWFASIKDLRLKAAVSDRLARFEQGNLGDVKPIGDAVSEARIHYGAGYRLYFIKTGKTIIVMLAGGDKSSQTRDINKAKELAKKWR
jgi:putative addiction module killer protein